MRTMRFWNNLHHTQRQNILKPHNFKIFGSKKIKGRKHRLRSPMAEEEVP